jgi:hypothetical protein
MDPVSWLVERSRKLRHTHDGSGVSDGVTAYRTAALALAHLNAVRFPISEGIVPVRA